jgi:hypothetical protein
MTITLGTMGLRPFAIGRETRTMEDPRFWILDVEIDSAPFGADTVAIVDENEGGIIAYVHRDNANRIVAALAQSI